MHGPIRATYANHLQIDVGDLNTLLLFCRAGVVVVKHVRGIMPLEVVMGFEERVERCLESIRDAYSKSWHSCLSCGGSAEKNVIRGRARCISGQVEDLIAEVVYDCVVEELRDVVVFVDTPLSYETGKINPKGKPELDICYPDVILTRPNGNGKMEVLYMIELKVNLGWKRHKLAGFEIRRDGNGKPVLDETGKKVRDSIIPIEDDMERELSKLQDVRVRSKVGVDKKGAMLGQCADGDDKIEFVINSAVWYDLVVCSSKNVPKWALEAAEQRIAKSNQERVQMFVLSNSELSGKHASKKELAMGSPKCTDDVARWGGRLELLVQRYLKGGN